MNRFPKIRSTRTPPVECLSKYIGLEFEPFGRGPDSFDCWGLVRFFYRQEFNIILPDLNGYSSVKDHKSIEGIVGHQKKDWVPDSAVYGNVVVFNMAGRPVHVGVVIDTLKMLHIQTGKQSCLERFTTPRWKNRIEGIYRFGERGHQAAPVKG